MSGFKDVERVPDSERVECTRCGERLVTAVWLELDCLSGRYTDAGDIPAERSQGWHPFGTACARRVYERTLAERGA